MQISRSAILKLSIFATGFSGVVAEYILSTLATYFLGDSIFQWIIVVSLMLFSMGLGSRLSKAFEHKLLRAFLSVEFALSLLVSFSPIFVYTLSAYTSSLGILIYSLAISIGLLIGMEIPLVIRLNEDYEQLRFNISNILENDYYGSLFGGVFFAFIGLPFLGLNYTPFVLGAINLSVSVLLLYLLKDVLSRQDNQSLRLTAGLIALSLIIGIAITKPIIRYGEQRKYTDKVIFAKQSPYQRIVITEWRGDHWLYLNGNEQLCSKDEILYHEPLVHPAVELKKDVQNVLVLGGGDGCAVRELLKYKQIKQIRLVDLDPEMTRLGQEHPVLTALNQDALNHEKVEIINTDGYHFLEEQSDYYDVIIIDLPDPKTVELGRLYATEFYKLCHKYLRPHGVLITQAGSPYFATQAFLCINKTMREAGFATVPLHNQVLTLGEWGWVLGMKQNPELSQGELAQRSQRLKERLRSLEFDVPTKWINNEAMLLMTSFGKDFYLWDKQAIEPNTIHNPVLYKYYNKGNWDLY